MKLHIFNPEHEMALAYDKCNITLPHAIQEFKNNLSFIPALWADDGDCVLTDDIPFALKALSRVRKPHADVLFLAPMEIKDVCFDEICPWGWDKSVKMQLIACGVDASLLPTDDLLLNIRELSGRQQTVSLLKILRENIEALTCGESFFIVDLQDLQSALERYNHIVVKAPWSSSGRGVRYIEKGNTDVSTLGWIRNVIKSQGGIMAEPYYNKLRDFAMEFYSYGDGTVDYRGLSVFNTEKGSYTGNLIASDSRKREIISRYISDETLTVIKERIINYFSIQLKNVYRGPFGVDMMIVQGNDGKGFLLHPCVEVNLRMTMGHVANALHTLPDGHEEVMRIVHDVNYQLKSEPTENNFVKVI